MNLDTTEPSTTVSVILPGQRRKPHSNRHKRARQVTPLWRHKTYQIWNTGRATLKPGCGRHEYHQEKARVQAARVA